MTDTGVVDQFLAVFTRYIDSGFGLIRGDVASLAQILVAIDVVLAALFWAWAPGEDILARLVKKTLYVGFFAFLIGNFNGLAKIIYLSFSGLGLKAAGAGMSASDFLHPGKIAQAGIDAGKPMLEAAGQLSGFPGFFENFVQIAVLLLAFVIVLIAFFILAVQLFVTLIEFKLTTLAGFVLVPFGLFGRTAFLAERVLGNVVASGVKVLVLAIIVGIGSTLFSQFVQTFSGTQPSLEQVLATALAAICLLGLGIFGPGIATGLVSGAPQLGAGAAVGTALTVGGLGMAGAMGVRAAVGAAGSLRAAAAGASAVRPGPGGSGGGSQRPPPPGPPSGSPGGGPAGSAPSSGGAPRSQGAATSAPAGGAASSDTASERGVPAWARRLEALRGVTHGVGTAAHAVRSGDTAGGATSVSLSEENP
ncbi:P-type conjugative transfer protein TrbL [Phenylobacterium sp.]|uniref:P-type conjugative transfer protein TrbL n=1 Tax=Phenylobacterium sp. TaxID=1871053 RepID=UPI002FC945B7